MSCPVRAGHCPARPLQLGAGGPRRLRRQIRRRNRSGNRTSLQARGTKSLHPVIALITDGEEGGLLGANAFLQNEAWKKQVGVVVNVEARGTRGASLLFQTSPGDGRLIDLYAKSVPSYATSSLYAEISSPAERHGSTLSSATAFPRSTSPSRTMSAITTRLRSPHQARSRDVADARQQSSGRGQRAGDDGLRRAQGRQRHLYEPVRPVPAAPAGDMGLAAVAGDPDCDRGGRAAGSCGSAGSRAVRNSPTWRAQPVHAASPAARQRAVRLAAQRHRATCLGPSRSPTMSIDRCASRSPSACGRSRCCCRGSSDSIRGGIGPGSGSRPSAC